MKRKSENLEQDELDRKELLENLAEYKERMAAGRQQFLRESGAEAMTREPYCNKDIYLVLVKTNERDELRRPLDRIFVRLSCPTPGYNQDVFKYRHSSGELEYLWSIPRKHQYWQIWRNLNRYLDNNETKRWATFVATMESGELLKWVKKENGEKPDAIIRVNQPITEA